MRSHGRASQNALEEAGYETREEETAAGAERALEEFEPELVVLEAALPDGDGFANWLAGSAKSGEART